MGGSADAFDFGLIDSKDLVDGQSIVEFKKVGVIENTFVVFFVVVAFAEAEPDHFCCGIIQNNENIGWSLISVKIFLRWSGAQSVANHRARVVFHDFDTGQVGVIYDGIRFGKLGEKDGGGE